MANTNTKYPWDKWFKRGRFRLVRGVDYHCTTHGMKSTAIQAGQRKGYRLSFRMDDGSLTVTVLGKVKR